MLSKNKVSVIQIIDSLDTGGAEFVAATVATQLAKRGWDSHLVTTRHIGPMIKDFSPNLKVWNANRSNRFDIKGIKRIIDYIKDNNIKIVHSHAPYTGYLVAIIRWLSRLKFIHIYHDHRASIPRKFLYGILDFIFFVKLNAYIGVSRELTSRAIKLLRLSHEKCSYIPNGVEVKPYSRKPSYSNHTVIQVANIHARKNHKTAIKAAAILRKQISDLNWLCLGSTHSSKRYIRELNKMIKRLAMDNTIQFLGAQSNVLEWLQKASVGVLTSHKEALPIALLEYMAEGLPVVVTSAGEMGNIVEAAKCGFVIEHDDPDALAGYLNKILTSPKLAAQLGKNGWQYVNDHHSVNIQIDKITNIYQSLIKNLT